MTRVSGVWNTPHCAGTPQSNCAFLSTFKCDCHRRGISQKRRDREEVAHRSKFFNFTANFLRNYCCFWWSFNGGDLPLTLSGEPRDDLAHSVHTRAQHRTSLHIAINPLGYLPQVEVNELALMLQREEGRNQHGHRGWQLRWTKTDSPAFLEDFLSPLHWLWEVRWLTCTQMLVTMHAMWPEVKQEAPHCWERQETDEGLQIIRTYLSSLSGLVIPAVKCCHVNMSNGNEITSALYWLW